MRNAEEHRKLLAQIAELEKNSVNYFDVEKEFFLITSDNLDKVQSKFYGYSIQRDGIYEEDNLTPEAVKNLDGRGCYVYVDVKDGKITIKQDLNGCWGIYLFRHGEYFALSNSFFRLLDYVKFKYPLTVDRDYCNYLVTDNLCSISHHETATNEIQLVDRNAILNIDIGKKQLQIKLIDYEEYTVPLNTKAGIETLDGWVEFWSNVLRGVAQHTNFIQADLSGGFDTRVSLVPLLHSGIDLNKIRVYSVKAAVHTFVEDYAIASKIAEHYGFELNRPFPPTQHLNRSFDDALNVDLYANLSFSNLPKIWLGKSVDKRYRLGGMSGETLRYRWQITPEKFIKTFIWKIRPYSPALSRELLTSIENILKSGINAVIDKHKIKDLNSKSIPQYLYHETWSRHHFGKETLCHYFSNMVRLSPALDPQVRTLRLDTSECPDANLLIALLFTRYEPDLLNFPLDLNRSIAPETIEYAKKINEQFPYVKNDRLSISGGGYSIYCRVIYALKKSSRPARTIQTFRATWRSVA